MQKLITQIWRQVAHLPSKKNGWLTFAFLIFLNFSVANPAKAQTKIWDKTYGGFHTDNLSSAQPTSDGGYILGGSSNSGSGGDKTEVRKNRYENYNYWIVKLKADGSKSWDKTIGGQDRDVLATVQQTRDGGYILGGSSQSRKSADKSEGNKGPLTTTDYWIVKLNKEGTKVWDKTIGGSNADRLSSLQQTSDGGYILGGSSVSPKSGDKSSTNKGRTDYWVVKLKADGSKAWDISIGGNADDVLTTIKQTTDGGYILGGHSNSPKSGDKTTSTTGGWLVKLKADGTKVWQKTIGNSIADLQQTKSGGYIVGGQVTSEKTLSDYLVVKLKADGTPVWQKTMGGDKEESLSSLQQTSDGGYLLGGSSNSDASGDKREQNQGASYYDDGGGSYDYGTPISDYWVVKLKPDGTKEWDKTIGSDRDDRLDNAFQTLDGHYILSGSSDSDRTGDKSEFNKGNYDDDYWLVKLDNNINQGKEQFITFKPILNQDLANATVTLQATATSGLPVSFSVASGPATVKNNQLTLTGTGTVTVKARQAGNANYDVAREVFQNFEVADLPVTQVWNKTYGGVITLEVPGNSNSECTVSFGSSALTSMLSTPDGGYLLGGTSDSKKGNDKSQDHLGSASASICFTSEQPITDYWVVKTDANGNKLWDKTYGTNQRDQLIALRATSDGGYILGGTTSTFYDVPNPYSGYYLVKLDANGNKLWDKKMNTQKFGTMSELITTPDGGYLISGSNSNGYSVMKVDGTGKIIWEKTFPVGLFRTMLATSDGGYLLGSDINFKGTANNSNLDYWLIKLDSQGNKLWDKTYGGSGADIITEIIATIDGNFLLGGYSTSGKSGEKSEDSRGQNDYWVIKVDAMGNKLWDKTYGGSTSDDLQAVIAAPDGGYLLGGNSSSPKSGDKSESNRGRNTISDTDYWILKIDSYGQKMWDKTLGGSGYDDQFRTLIADPDGSYVIGGRSSSPVGGDKEAAPKGLQDYWVIKVKEKNPLETTPWNRRYGGNGTDNLTTTIKTSDGGYLSGGYTTAGATGDKSQSSQGKNDYWIVKSDQNGKKEWDKRYGGSEDDYLNSVIQTQDGGYLLAGSSFSGAGGDKSQVSRGERDYWIVKIDKLGNKLWDKRYGGTGSDELKKVIQLASGRYLLAGSSNSPQSGDKSQPSQGQQDYWLVKIEADGQKVWDRSYGGSGEDLGEDVALLSNGDLLLGGSSFSSSGGDRTQGNRGSSDYWVLRLDGSGQKVWDRTFGGAREDKLMALGTTAAGNFYLAGTSTSKNSGEKTQTSQGGSDYWLLEISTSGNKRWDKAYGGHQDEDLRAVVLTPDQGYLLAGSSASEVSGAKTQASQGATDYWVVKLDPQGHYQWDQRQGGSDTEELRSALLTPDGGYLLAGRSNSGVSGERTQPSQGSTDYWLVKITAPPATSMLARRTAALAAEPTAELHTLLAYPNPFQDKITITFTLPETQTATVRILDGQGREIITLFQEEAQANHTYQLEWQATKQEAAMYLLQLQTPTDQYTRKLLLSK